MTKPAAFQRYRYKAASGPGGLVVTDPKFFRYNSGESMSFRIQTGLDDSLRSKLEDAITAHGGLLTSKIPLKGVIVVDPKSKDGTELVKSWKRKDRPERYFVDYGYVLKCEREKRLLPLENTVLEGGKKPQRELSQEAKDKLALYLATKLPVDAETNRSSKQIYMDLVKEKEKYPWVRRYSWRMFHDHYCKNKKYYDKLIGYIILFRPSDSTATEGASKAKHKAKDYIQPSQAKSKRSKLFVEAKSEKQEQVGLKVKITRKRKFADDITNVGEGHAMKSIDEMLRKPLPRLKGNKRQRRAARKNTEVQKLKLEDDHDEIEVARSAKSIQPARTKDVWVDDEFRGKSNLKAEFEEGAPGETQYNLTAMSSKLDLDDLRSAVALNSTLLKEDEDTEDEDYVARLLGLTDLPQAREIDAENMLDPFSLISTANSGRTGNNTILDNHRKAEIEILAQEYHFTIEETTLKLTAFNGNLGTTRKFFTRCREVIDGLFAAYLTDSGALDLSAPPLTTVKADQGELKEEDVSSELFPARNTRARKARRARKEKE